MNTHAQSPTPVYLGNHTIRLFVSFLDLHGVGRIGYIDVDERDPTDVLGISETPSLDIGRDGTFDDNGVVPGSVIQRGANLYLYYSGYQKGVKVRYSQFTGIAVSNDGGNSFKKVSETPALDRTEYEIFGRTAPFVMKDDHKFKMWYSSWNDWVRVDGKEVPHYVQRYLESKNGYNWPRSGLISIEPHGKDEYGIGRSYVAKVKNRYHMYYSSRLRSKGYRIGYAESADGMDWVRKNNVDITVSSRGWDSEMVLYPHVYSRDGYEYLFYNGNDFGKTGVGFCLKED